MAITNDPAPAEPGRGADPRVETGTQRHAGLIALAPIALALWTLFVWGGRIRNVVADLGDGGSVGWFPLVASPVFVALGLAVLAGIVIDRYRPPRPAILGAALPVLAALSIAVWVVRGIDIALGDHSAGFIVVHTVLALVSIGLGAAVLVRRRR